MRAIITVVSFAVVAAIGFSVGGLLNPFHLGSAKFHKLPGLGGGIVPCPLYSSVRPIPQATSMAIVLQTLPDLQLGCDGDPVGIHLRGTVNVYRNQVPSTATCLASGTCHVDEFAVTSPQANSSARAPSCPASQTCMSVNGGGLVDDFNDKYSLSATFVISTAPPSPLPTALPNDPPNTPMFVDGPSTGNASTTWQPPGGGTGGQSYRCLTTTCQINATFATTINPATLPSIAGCSANYECLTFKSGSMTNVQTNVAVGAATTIVISP